MWRKIEKKIKRKIAAIKPEFFSNSLCFRNKSGVFQAMTLINNSYIQPLHDLFYIPNYFAVMNGSGFTSCEARVKSQMEAIERYSSASYFTNRKNVLIYTSLKGVREIYQEAKIISPKIINKKLLLSDNHSEKIFFAWFKANTPDNKTVLIPASYLIRTVTGSAGMASGLSLNDAILRAIYEIIEREHLDLIIKQKIRCPTININSFCKKDRDIKNLIRRLVRKKQKVTVKDFSLNGKIPVIGIIRQINQKFVIVNASSAGTPLEAFRKALLENTQKEGLIKPEKNYQRTNQVNYLLCNLDELKNPENMPEIKSSITSEEIGKIGKILKEFGHEIIYIETTSPVIKIPTVWVYILNLNLFQNKQLRDETIIRSLCEDALLVRDFKILQKIISFYQLNHKNTMLYWYYQGLINQYLQNYNKAIKDFEKSLDSKTDEAEFKQYLRINIGLCYTIQKNYRKALKLYAENISLYPFLDFYFLKSQYRPDNARAVKTACLLYQGLLKAKINNHFPINP